MSQTEIEYLAWEAKIEAANYERESARDSMRPFSMIFGRSISVPTCQSTNAPY